MSEGSQFDIALGWLGPNIDATPSGFPSSDSDATSFLMPAMGYASKTGKLTWAAGVFAQGGMGAEYDDPQMTMGTGDIRSEVGVGRAMIAAAYNVNDRLNVGGSVDIVWAGMDLQMAVPGGMMNTFDPLTRPWGLITGGTLAMDYGDAGMQWGRFDFSNDSDFTGEAMGYGYGAKIGLTYKINDMATVGATYHSKTNLSDLETSNATLSMGTFDPVTGAPITAAAMTGSIDVRDFQWPATYGVGIAVTPNSKTLVALDVKRILWSDVMDSFQMTFTADPAFGGGTLDVAMGQMWDDQTVIQGGIGYQVNNKLVVRAGFNFADNPIPDQTVNPLFPATIEKHYTVGFGYQVSPQGNLNASMTYAPEVTVTNPGIPGVMPATTINHSQFAGQVMYSHRF
jgi:long-chain fatty acid transport protein